jgi:polar amino acid transport system substrate-binding protein
VVPRARAEAMLRQGEADLMVGAVQVPERDQWGRYVPMIGTEWMLVSTDADPPRSTGELLARPGIRLNVVRSYNYGPAYLALLARLDKQGRLEYVKDPQTIARKMDIGRASYAYMPSNTFAGALEETGLRDSLGQRVHYTRLAGIPPSTSGVYISRKTAPDDAGGHAGAPEPGRRAAGAHPQVLHPCRNVEQFCAAARALAGPGCRRRYARNSPELA